MSVRITCAGSELHMAVTLSFCGCVSHTFGGNVGGFLYIVSAGVFLKIITKSQLPNCKI